MDVGKVEIYVNLLNYKILTLPFIYLGIMSYWAN